MKTAERTPTPWPAPEYHNDTGPGDEGFWDWWEIEGVAKFDAQEDAELARLAVNAHGDLFEALKLAVASYEDPSIWLDGAREALAKVATP